MHKVHTQTHTLTHTQTDPHRSKTLTPRAPSDWHLWENINLCHRSKYSIYAYTSSGTTSFSHATSDFRKGNFSTSSANYSFDGDGTFHKKKGAGDYDVIQFDGRTPSRVVASVAIEFGPKLRNYEQVFVYAVVHTDYENLIEEGTAENSLRVMNSSGKDIRTMEFKSPVKQGTFLIKITSKLNKNSVTMHVVLFHKCTFKSDVMPSSRGERRGG